MESDLRTLLAPLDREAARTGVKYLPPWLTFADELGCWYDNRDHNEVGPDAARMIAEASIARTLRARGVGVVLLDTVWYTWKNEYVGLSPLDATDDLSALIAAMLKVYNTLPDAAKGWE